MSENNSAVQSEEATAPQAEEVVAEAPVALTRPPQEKKKITPKLIWDKITTGLFILLLSSPILILLFILMWFVNR